MMTTMVIVTILHKMEAVMCIGMMHTLITMLLVAVVTIVVIGYHRE